MGFTLSEEWRLPETFSTDSLRIENFQALHNTELDINFNDQSGNAYLEVSGKDIVIERLVLEAGGVIEFDTHSGFGFIVAQRQSGSLLIATCNHLTRHFDQQAEKIQLMFRGSGKWQPVQLLESHETLPRDLAVLEVEKPLGFTMLKECMSPSYDSLKGI